MSTTQDVNVVRADSPSQFYVKPLHFLAMEEDLEREIEAFTEGILGNLVLPDWLPTAEIGMPCLAMRKDSKKWCRAEVQSVLPRGGIVVMLVDEGVRQFVFPSDLRPINAKLVDMPATVVECKLKDVVPMKGNFWDESVCEVFREMVLDCKLELTVDEDGADLFKEIEDQEEEVVVEDGEEQKTVEVEDSEKEKTEEVEDTEKEQREETEDTEKEESEEAGDSAKETNEETEGTENETVEDAQDTEKETTAEGEDTEKEKTEENAEREKDTEKEETEKATDTAKEETEETEDTEKEETEETKDAEKEETEEVEDGEKEKMEEDGDAVETKASEVEGTEEEVKDDVEDVEKDKAEEVDDAEKEDTKGAENSEKKKSISKTLKEMGLAREPGTEEKEEEDIADPDAVITLYFLSINGPSELVCQPAASADKLQELMDSIFEFYSDESNQGGVTPEVGLQCISKFTEDDGWYRATIEAVSGADITVRYTDYGNSEVVTQDRLRNLDPQFAKLRPQARTYQLAAPLVEESKWSDDVKVHLEGCCAERELKVNILDTSGDNPTIRLSPEDTAFIQTSLEALPPPAAAAPPVAVVAPVVATSTVVAPQPGEAIDLIFLSAEGPSTVICQPLSTADDLAMLMDNIAAHYEDEANQSGFTPVVGVQCIAKFTEDDGWYRAEVKAIDDGSVTVRYIDYGNSEALTTDRLCPIQEEFTQLPPQAITYEIAPPIMHSSQWSDEVKALLDGTCVERELKGTLLAPSGDVSTIKLSEGDVTFIQTTLGDSLPPVGEPAATTDEVLKLGEAINLIFLSADGPSTFTCQPLSTADDLATLMDNIAAHYEDEANQGGFTPVVGVQCIAKFTEDDGWYRAEVKAVDDGSITVRYIDYGNSEALTTDRLCPIQEEFAQLPSQAIAYNIAPSLLHSSQWSDDVKALLDESCAERELKGHLLPDSRDIPAVKLSDEDATFIKTALGDSLPPVVETAPAAKSQEVLELGEAISLIFLAADGHSTFSCQPTSTADALATLMDEIAAFYEEAANQVEFTPQAGQQCIAQFTEDDGWYRAVVQEINDDDYVVKYVDYGNTETLKQDRLREVQPQFQELPHQAIMYTIKPDLMHPSQWNDDVKGTLDETCAEREFKGHLVKTPDDSIAVKLSQEDEDFVKSSIAGIPPPVVEDDKDVVDDIVQALVNTAITDALDEMTAPATIQQAAGVTVMTLFDKVAECLLIEELKKDDDVPEEEDTMKGVKQLVDDIVKKAVQTVTGEEQEEEDLPHQILDEIIETVAGSLHISSATEVLEEGEVQGVELPSPQRKRHKSGDGLPGVEADTNDAAPSEEASLEETTKEVGEPDEKKPKIKEDESDSNKGGEEQDQEEGDESAENFEDAADNVVDDKTGDAAEEEAEQEEDASKPER